MDSLTHIVLGACIGEAVAGRQVGKKAMLIGAIAQSIPDIDFVAAFFLSDTEDIVAHRGITHSLLFVVLGSFLLARLTARILPNREMSAMRWLLLFGINMFVHIFIDSFNAYGTGWFEPFSHARLSFNVLYVADPLFSIWPFFAALLLLFIKRDSIRRATFWKIGIGLSVVYLVYALYNKWDTDKAVRRNLAAQHLPSDRYFTTPTLFNTLLWQVTVSDGKGYHIGYRSVFDKEEKINFSWFPRQDSLLDLVENKEEVRDLERFADGYYTVDKRNDTLLFNVIRFGQIAGWDNPHARFAFYYYCDRPGANNMVVQRGRFEAWDRNTTRSFITRIFANGR
ncbi:MAG: metal-dependent hydrolase [Chitinophagaceae bacterium]|nr:metal-dependent hydrolase [Chitinophagaceae bacterium]